MEDTLREAVNGTSVQTEGVLILVLMEDTLRVFVVVWLINILLVLILVLMEDTLRDKYYIMFNLL